MRLLQAFLILFLLEIVVTYQVRYTMSNTSPFIVMVGLHDFPFVWKEHVDVYRNGQRVNPKVQKPQLPRGEVLHMLPKEKFSVVFNLADHYDLEEGSTYTVQTRPVQGPAIRGCGYVRTSLNQPRVLIEGQIDNKSTLKHLRNDPKLYGFDMYLEGLPNGIDESHFRSFMVQESNLYEFTIPNKEL